MSYDIIRSNPTGKSIIRVSFLVGVEEPLSPGRTEGGQYVVSAFRRCQEARAFAIIGAITHHMWYA